MNAPKPDNEAERLAALHDYHILDTAAEQAYDDIALLAACICEVPIATISLVDDSRQWFKSRLGLSESETPRKIAFCAHTILKDQPLIVPDTLKDKRFAHSPLVTQKPFIRFYAGFPLLTPEGHALGALCALDRKPRKLSAAQKQAMDALSRQVMALLELWRISAQLADTLEHVKTLRGLLPICAWCKSIRDDDGYWKKVEAYVSSHSEAAFTHGICPDCLEQERPKKGVASHQR